MRLTIILFFIIQSTASCQTAKVTEKDFDKLLWLEGTWTRTNSKPGRNGTEHWVRGKGKELMGWGVSMKGSDTTFVEKFKLIAKSGALYYVADVPENQKPVDFLLTSIDADGFVCENSAHDFPKKISYHRNGNSIRTVISGDGKEMEFLFERQRP
jgi:hypothetical protein